MMQDVETSIFDPETLLNYIIYSYAERDHQIYIDSGVNVLEFMIEKAVKYKLDLKGKDPEIVQEWVKNMEFRKFYSLFSIEDLAVLGY